MAKSHNRTVLKNLIRQERNYAHEEIAANFNYFVLYSFFYKYVSDTFKNFLESSDIDDIYGDEETRNSLRQESLKELGYFIKSPKAFVDDVVDEEYTGDYYGSRFFSKLQECIEFESGSECEKYFTEIFSIVKNAVTLEFQHDSRSELILRDYIRYIIKFDINEEEFSFRDVYDIIASLRNVKVPATPDYISELLTAIITSQKNSVGDVYDPFLRDGSCLFDVSSAMKIEKVYGKDDNELSYFYCLIKAIINGFGPENISFYNEDAIKSMSVDNRHFDLIVSNISGSSKYSRRYFPQSLESPKADDNSELKDDLLLKFRGSELEKDKNVMDALNTLLREVEASKISNQFAFDEEYESLNDSEFLFIINMLNCLKDDGIMAISLSQNFLFKKSLTLLRKFLTHGNNYIDAVISVPEGLGRGVRPEVVIIFRKDKGADDIVFIDISKKYRTKKSHKAVAGLMRRNLLLSDGCLDKIVDIYRKREIIDGLSNVISLKQLEENDFNLSMSRYVDTYGGKFIKLEDLAGDKKEIDSNLEKLNKKIEKMMEDMDIRL